MPIDPLPSAPLPTDNQATFNTKAFNLVAALGTFVTQTNAVETAVDADAATASAAATTASNAAATALAAGTSITGTSTSTLTIGTGSKSLTIETGRAFVAGIPVRIGEAGVNANINFMDGDVTSYVAGTGALVVNVTDTGGSGTLSSWSVRANTVRLPVQTGNGGRVLKTNGSTLAWETPLAVGATITGNTTLVATDAPSRAVAMTALANCITLPVATTLPNGWEYVFDNNGTREFGVRLDGGQLLATVQPGITARFTLLDNTTAAGTWGAYGEGLLQPLTVANVDWGSNYDTSNYSANWALPLTPTLSLHGILSSANHQRIYAVDCSTYPATVGTPVQVFASSDLPCWQLPISSTKALLFYANGSMYHATVSGTTVTISAGLSGSYGDTSKRRWNGVDGIGSMGPAACVVGASNDRVLSLSNNGTLYLIDVSGAAPALVSGGTLDIRPPTHNGGGLQACYIYKVSNSGAVIFMTANSGAPQYDAFVRAVTYSGSTITAGSAVTIDNDTLSTGGSLHDIGVAQLSASNYITAVYQANGSLCVAGVSVSGTTCTVSSFSSPSFTTWQPWYFGAGPGNKSLLYAVNSTTAVLTGRNASGRPVRMIYTFNGSTLSQFSGFENLSSSVISTFCQTPTGFITAVANSGAGFLTSFNISGSTLSVNGSAYVDLDGNVDISSNSDGKFRGWSLSGGYGGFVNDANRVEQGRMCLFRYRANSPPQMLGNFALNNSTYGYNGRAQIPTELAPNRIAFQTKPEIGPSGSTSSQLQILEFPA
jgi:hypothetical protein